MAPESTLRLRNRAPEGQSDIFPEGRHRATFTINHLQGAEKERIEEIVLTRTNHARPNETLTLVESGDHMVVHQRFASLVSVQEMIAMLRTHRIETGLQIVWDDDVTADIEDRA